jgi:hypothetical protein
MFIEWLIQNKRLPLILQGLAAEALKAGSFENFRKDYLFQILALDRRSKFSNRFNQGTKRYVVNGFWTNGYWKINGYF